MRIRQLFHDLATALWLVFALSAMALVGCGGDEEIKPRQEDKQGRDGDERKTEDGTDEAGTMHLPEIDGRYLIFGREIILTVNGCWIGGHSKGYTIFMANGIRTVMFEDFTYQSGTQGAQLRLDGATITLVGDNTFDFEKPEADGIRSVRLQGQEFTATTLTIIKDKIDVEEIKKVYDVNRTFDIDYSAVEKVGDREKITLTISDPGWEDIKHDW